MVRSNPQNFTAMAQRAYEEITEVAPAEVPTWANLHPVERAHLVRFAETIARLSGTDSH